MRSTTDAIVAWKALSGVACIYKPSGLQIQTVKNTILSNLCNELNEMNIRPPNKMVDIVGSTNAPMQVNLVTDLTDHVSVVGPRFQMTDIRCHYATHLSRSTSGVLLMGFNRGTRDVYQLNVAKLTRAFKVHGVLGKATDNYYASGKVVEKSVYSHVTRGKIDKVVSYMQSMHQKKMYELCGVDMNSQTGYELAAQGLLRPADDKIPILYGIRCVNFESPNFIIEVQSVNEYEKYLHTLIHDIGIQLRTSAYCTKVQCIRQGKFTVDDALLKKHWTLQDVLNSISNCRRVMKENPQLLRPASASLQ